MRCDAPCLLSLHGCSFAVQAAPELHIGLRTGYCGSLTTFASWEFSLVTGLIGGALPCPCMILMQHLDDTTLVLIPTVHWHACA